MSVEEPIAPRRTSARPSLPPGLAHQLVKFAIVGLANTAIGLGVFALALAAGVWYPAASALAFAAGAVNGYTLNRVWTFRAGAFHAAGFARYVAIQGVALAMNVVLVVAL